MTRTSPMLRDLRALGAHFRDEAEAVLRFALSGAVGNIALVSSFGADSAVLLHMVLVGITAACVVSTIALLVFAFGLLDNERVDVDLPNFVGMTLSSVQSNEKYKSFKLNIVEQYNSDDAYPVGTIFDQSPLPPKQNRFPFPVEAGEKNAVKKDGSLLR